MSAKPQVFLGLRAPRQCYGVSASGRRHGVTELGPEVVNYVSHAAQQRLQTLLEKVSQVAQQKNISFKVCSDTFFPLVLICK